MTIVVSSSGASSGGGSAGDAAVAGVPARCDAALLAVALDLALELVDELVDRRLHVAGGLACTQHGPLRPDGRLGHVVVRDRRVLLDGELELDARRVAHEPVELAELLLGVRADLLADLEVTALDLETHGVREDASERPART